MDVIDFALLAGYGLGMFALGYLCRVWPDRGDPEPDPEPVSLPDDDPVLLLRRRYPMPSPSLN